MADTDLTGLSEINALLGAGTEYEGKLVFQGRVRLDGRFVGEIRGSDVLILGPTAVVEASVDVGALIVLGGTLRGSVLARRVVELHAPGAVYGDIETPQLFIDKGATFEGKCAMGEVASEVHPLPAAERMALALGAAPAAGVEAPDDEARPGAEAPAPTGGDADVPEGQLADLASDDELPFVRAPRDDDAPAPASKPRASSRSKG